MINICSEFDGVTLWLYGGTVIAYQMDGDKRLYVRDNFLTEHDDVIARMNVMKQRGREIIPVNSLAFVAIVRSWILVDQATAQPVASEGVINLLRDMAAYIDEVTALLNKGGSFPGAIYEHEGDELKRRIGQVVGDD